MKEEYTEPKVEIIVLDGDVITTSGCNGQGGGNELPLNEV